MNQVTINTELLKDLIKESVKEILHEERLSLYLSFIPTVSVKEMKEIEKICGKPSDYDKNHFVDISDWF